MGLAWLNAPAEECHSCGRGWCEFFVCMPGAALPNSPCADSAPPVPTPGDYEARSLAVLSRSGVYVSILNSGWLQKYGQAAAGALMLWGLVKG